MAGSPKGPRNPRVPSSFGSSDEGTRVDLGEDLLEQATRILTLGGEAEPSGANDAASGSGDPGQDAASSSFDSEDQFESARILKTEGMFEDAKKVLRQILIRDPGHVPSRQLLDEIHDFELKQMFGDAGSRRASRRGGDPESLPGASDEVMQRLERDLSLAANDSSPYAGSLDEQFGGFGDRVDEALVGASARDRIDSGIAFLEMGLHGLASRQFRAAMNDPGAHVEALALHCYALILAERPYEALLSLEAILGDPDLADDHRTEFLYLLGRSQEGMKRPDLASDSYRAAEELRPGYRDASDRLKKLAGR